MVRCVIIIDKNIPMEKEERSVPLTKALTYGVAVIAIVVAGSFAYQKHFIETNMPALVKQAINDMTPNPDKVAPVTSADHLLGSIKAPIKLVVYTDLECPYCKTIHDSISELKNDYIKDGKMAVVYRNLPLDQLHTKARPEAIATECAAKLGGNEKYWSFVDKIFAATPSNDGLDLNLLSVFAADLGLDKEDFAACQKDEKIAQIIKKQEANGQEAGAQGTPYPIVILNDEVKGVLPGALPADQMRKMVDELTGVKQ